LLLMPYFVYVLKSKSTGTSYVGSTSNLKKRLSEHINGKSTYTRGKGPWNLMHYEEFLSRSEAVQRERYFKSVEGRIELKNQGFI